MYNENILGFIHACTTEDCRKVNCEPNKSVFIHLNDKMLESFDEDSSAVSHHVMVGWSVSRY